MNGAHSGGGGRQQTLLAASFKSIASASTSADAEALLRADPVTAQDLRAALETTKSSSDGHMDRYVIIYDAERQYCFVVNH
jgi:hypothetical protein